MTCLGCGFAASSWQHRAACGVTEIPRPASRKFVTVTENRVCVTEIPSTVTEIQGVTKKRGRPRKADAMSPAERARAYRERRRDRRGQ